MSSIPLPSTEAPDGTFPIAADAALNESATKSPARSSSATDAAGDSRLYRVVWRWHFYAGLLTVPVLCTLALTGVILTFETEIVEWRDRELLFVTPQSERLGYDALRTAVADARGYNDFESIVVYPDPTRSVQFVGHVHAADDHDHEHEHPEHEQIFVDPYSGEILGIQGEGDAFFRTMLDLHRNLMAGTTGRLIAELTTGWTVILLATGLYLWWPRGKSNVGVWVPRVRGKVYAVLRDWHSVSGAWLFPVMFLVVGTGLFFSPVQGTIFNSSVKAAGHWPIQEWFSPPQYQMPTNGASAAPLDVVVPAFLSQARPDDAVRITFATQPDHAHRAWLIRDQDKNSFRQVDVDQYTGEVLKVVGGADLKLGYRIRLWAVSIHMGQIFGMPTKILAFIASLLVFGLSFTGVWMWWRRRPKGRTGFPARPKPGSVPKWGWAVVVATGVVMPVAGVSFLLLAVGDTIVARWRRNELQDRSEGANPNLDYS